MAERVYFGAGATQSSSSSSSSVSSVGTVVTDPKEVIYMIRNKKVLEAAQAGRSRWGSQEIERISNVVASTNMPVVSTVIQQQQPQYTNFGAEILRRQ